MSTEVSPLNSIQIQGNINGTVPGVKKISSNSPTQSLTDVQNGRHRFVQHHFASWQVPLDWRQANVTAVFKKGDKTSTSKYRPVCILCKTMEYVVCSLTMGHLDNYNKLVHFKHGFRFNHSCKTQLLTTVDDLSHLTKIRPPTSWSWISVRPSRLCPTDASHSSWSIMVSPVRSTSGLSFSCVSTSREKSLIGQPPQILKSTTECPRHCVGASDVLVVCKPHWSQNITSHNNQALRWWCSSIARTIDNPSDELQLQHNLDTMIVWSNTWLMRFNERNATYWRSQGNGNHCRHNTTLKAET